MPYSVSRLAVVNPAQPAPMIQALGNSGFMLGSQVTSRVRAAETEDVDDELARARAFFKVAMRFDDEHPEPPAA